ncbi:hypothetical protein E1K98_10890 [Salmonella enterica subsp. enterica serovar Fluntern]|nr:hypothetical protein [Salmonella enterica subsp. enterica serovar Fluntern]EAB1663819.1 hypothetical protein [Salmonella enterica]ECI0552092.1 hypothetical protein [Salmonella enterica subsp. enterica]EAA3236054.1 hypothetical protein [Salmonella enterica subsp. enterica serovar Fluntern]EAP9555774.1 hypothetical protein [Salmonella enterica]
MRSPGLKLSLPSDISDTFCTILDEYAIQHSSVEEKSNGPKLAVNSASGAAKDIIIEIVNSAPFWAAFSACFIAYLNRNRGKKASIEKDGKKISLENITHHEMAKFLEDAKTVVFREDNDKKPT